MICAVLDYTQSQLLVILTAVSPIAGRSESAFCCGNIVAWTLHMLNVSHTRQELAEVMCALQDFPTRNAGYP